MFLVTEHALVMVVSQAMVLGTVEWMACEPSEGTGGRHRARVTSNEDTDGIRTVSRV